MGKWQLTFVLQDVLGVGQHAGEGAAEEQPQGCRAHKQENHAGGENQEQQEGDEDPDLRAASIKISQKNAECDRG